MESVISEDKNSPIKAGPKEWWGLAILALPCLLYAMDFTVLQLAIPDLIRDLQPSSSQLLWIMDIYGFVLAATLITMGVLGDRIGRRKLLLIGALFFGAASIAAAFATTPNNLILARALLGLAAATLAPSTLSLIRNMFHDPKQRAFAVGIWMISFSVGSALGPLIGGALLMHFWWGSVFLVAIPVMVLLLITGPRLLPEFKDKHAGRLDITSAALSLLAILPIIYSLKDLASHGLSIVALTAILIGVIFGYLFLRRQRILAHPFIDMSLFASRMFNVLLATYIGVFFVTFAVFYFISQYLQLVRDMTPLEAGLWTLPWAGAFIISSLIVPKLVKRWDLKKTLVYGLLVSTAGLAVLATIHTETSLAFFAAGLAMVSFGFAPAMVLITDSIIGSVPKNRAGMASGISETASELGGALGIALLGSVATFIYISTISDALPGDTIGATVAAAGELSSDEASFVLNNAKDAFIASLHWVFIISAAVISLATLAVQKTMAKYHR